MIRQSLCWLVIGAHITIGILGAEAAEAVAKTTIHCVNTLQLPHHSSTRTLQSGISNSGWHQPLFQLPEADNARTRKAPAIKQATSIQHFPGRLPVAVTGSPMINPITAFIPTIHAANARLACSKAKQLAAALKPHTSQGAIHDRGQTSS